MVELGLALVALGVVIALFIIFANLASNVQSSAVNDPRRGFIKGVIMLAVAGILTAELGSLAVEELFEQSNILTVQSGDTFTVENELSYNHVHVRGHLNVKKDGHLRVTGNE